MVQELKYKIKKVFFPYKFNSAEFIRWLKEEGKVTCGEHTFFFDVKNTFVDTQRPWMLEIGDYCKITRGVIILQHDYSWSVLRRKYGEIIDTAKPTHIGNNVFIGMNSIILMGAHIGDNVIVGAGSVVSGTIPSDVVVAGNPARIICSLDEYYEKRKKSNLDEAVCCATLFKDKRGYNPTINDLGAFFPIYLARELEQLQNNNIKVNLSGDDINDVVKNFLNSDSIFAGFEEFLEYAYKNKLK